MVKKDEKRLCWNCDGYVGKHLAQCPYCAVDLHPSDVVSPFASQWNSHPNVQSPSPKKSVFSQDFSVSDKEWTEALEQEKEEEKNNPQDNKKESVAFLLLLPGFFFLLFGFALMFFSDEGIFLMQWKQNYAYFYWLASIPLLYIGWRIFR